MILHTYTKQAGDGSEGQGNTNSINLVHLSSATEAVAEIGGGPERYVQIGSSVHLKCIIKDYTEPPTYVFWYHAEHMVNYDSNKRVSMIVM